MEQEKLQENENNGDIEEGPSTREGPSRPSGDLDGRSEELDRWTTRFIIEVPPNIRRLNSDAYMPRAVSFGPYHHGQEHLKPMEAHKRRSLSNFLKRSSCSLEDYYNAVREVVLQLREYYEHLDEEWPVADAFLEMMVVDGCFLLEYLQSYTKPTNNCDAAYPIFGDFVWSNITRDMLLMENQLPLLLLQRLLAAHTGKDEVREDLNKIILGFFSWHCFTIGDACLHLLDIFQEGVIRRINHRERSCRKFFPGPKFPSAIVLYNTGVKFERASTDIINFYGLVLRLPRIAVDKDTETLFLNLMALEKLRVMKSNGVSSYVAFMALLVPSAKDVKLLRSQGIIAANESEMSDDAIAKLFNELAKNPVNDPDDSLCEVRSALERWPDIYIRNCNERLANWGSNFIQGCCKNPWTAIGVVAGTILLVATVTQTVYAVLQFYQDG